MLNCTRLLAPTGASNFLEHYWGPLHLDAAHGRATPGGTFFGLSMKDATKCLILLALAHMIDQESSLSWGDMIRCVYTSAHIMRLFVPTAPLQSP